MPQTFYNDTPGDPNLDAPKALGLPAVDSPGRNMIMSCICTNVYSGKATSPKWMKRRQKWPLPSQSCRRPGFGCCVDRRNPSRPSHRCRLMPPDAGKVETCKPPSRIWILNPLAAPFDGEVATVTANIGDFCSPGQVLVVLADTSHLPHRDDRSERTGCAPGQARPGGYGYHQALNQESPGKSCYHRRCPASWVGMWFTG